MQDLIIMREVGKNKVYAIWSKLVTADDTNYYCKRVTKKISKKIPEKKVPEFFSVPVRKLDCGEGDAHFVTIRENEKMEDFITPWEPDEYTKWRIENP